MRFWKGVCLTHIRRTTVLGLEVNADASCSTPSGLMPSSVRLGEPGTEDADTGGGDQRQLSQWAFRCTRGFSIDRNVQKESKEKRGRK